LARRIVAHVSTREPENGHETSKSFVFKFFSGEMHGNLEAEFAVLTPACSSSVLVGRLDNHKNS
jgi:hypothetical protein